MVASFWIIVQKFSSAKMIGVKFCSAFPDDEVCGGLGDFICFCFVSNWIALVLFYNFGYNLHLVSLFFLG